jgi:hypothetical protein
MKNKVLAGIKSDKEKRELEASRLAGNMYRERLIAVFEKKLEEAEVSSLATDNYGSPSWAFKQADVVGYKRAVRELITYLL